MLRDAGPVSIFVPMPGTTIWYYAPKSSLEAKQVGEYELKRSK